MPQGLLPQDVVVLTKLIWSRDKRPAITQLADDLGLSPSQIHLSLKRLERSRLIRDAAKERQPLSMASQRFHRRRDANRREGARIQ